MIVGFADPGRLHLGAGLREVPLDPRGRGQVPDERRRHHPGRLDRARPGQLHERRVVERVADRRLDVRVGRHRRDLRVGVDVDVEQVGGGVRDDLDVALPARASTPAVAERSSATSFVPRWTFRSCVAAGRFRITTVWKVGFGPQKRGFAVEHDLRLVVVALEHVRAPSPRSARGGTAPPCRSCRRPARRYRRSPSRPSS